MKIEFANKTVIPFSQLVAGQCFLDKDDNVCLACEDYWVVILTTGEIFEVESPNEYEVRLISAKIVLG